MATISLQLAIFNLLPIPILDGGAILMLLIEMIMRRDMSLNVKETVFKVGLAFIMMLVAFAIRIYERYGTFDITKINKLKG